jgi:hypothetical protein
MEYGIALASNVDAWKTFKRAEELPFTHAWVFNFNARDSKQSTEVI